MAAARLGLKSAYVGNVGADQNGKDCINAFKSENVCAKFIKIHKDKKPTIIMSSRFKDERTILIKHEEFAYEMPHIGSPKWIYLSSLGENSLPFHQEIENYLKFHPETNLAFQPGTFQIKFGKGKLAGLYRMTKVFICNLQEAQRILGTKEDKPLELMRMMSWLGPKILVITDGTKGAYATMATMPGLCRRIPTRNRPLSAPAPEMLFPPPLSLGWQWAKLLRNL